MSRRRIRTKKRAPWWVRRRKDDPSGKHALGRLVRGPGWKRALKRKLAKRAKVIKAAKEARRKRR